MNDLTIDALNRRLERLERAARRWKWCCMSLAVVAISMAIGGANQADEPTRDVIARNVTADSLILKKSLILQNAEGKYRAALTLVEDEAALTLLGKDGKSSIAMYMSKGVKALEFYDAAGVSRIWMSVGQDGIPIITLADQNHKPRMAMAVMQDSMPGLMYQVGNNQPVFIPPR